MAFCVLTRRVAQILHEHKKMKIPSACLHTAAKTGNVAILRVLVQHPGFKPHEINARDRDGRSALHLAAAKGHLSAIVVLKRAGADSSARTQSAMTPFDVAQDKVLLFTDSKFDPMC